MSQTKKRLNKKRRGNRGNKPNQLLLKLVLKYTKLKPLNLNNLIAMLKEEYPEIYSGTAMEKLVEQRGSQYQGDNQTKLAYIILATIQNNETKK